MVVSDDCHDLVKPNIVGYDTFRSPTNEVNNARHGVYGGQFHWGTASLIHISFASYQHQYHR
jgi:hypothetical protein